MDHPPEKIRRDRRQPGPVLPLTSRCHHRIFGLCLILVALNLPFPETSDSQDRLIDLALTGSYTTSSKLFFNTGATDEIVRDQFLGLDNIFGIGLELRRTIPRIDLQIAVSVDYLSKTERFGVPVGPITVPVTDGFWAVPVELSALFRIPVGGEHLNLYMGGGGGIYFGGRRYEYAGVDALTTDRTPGLGIHITSGLEYRLSEVFSLRLDLKFRDVEFETTNRFNRLTATFQGRFVELDQNPLVSRTNVNGMGISLGPVIHF